LLDNIESTPAQGSSSATEREILLKEIGACLHKALPAASRDRDCRIFWLHYRAGMSARAIAALPSIGLSTKGVESTLLRLVRLVRQELDETTATGF
jgi:RNA polymerase sigma-70 factor (ECF subfamily)